MAIFIGGGRWNVCQPQERIGKRFFSAGKWRNIRHMELKEASVFCYVNARLTASS
jgi:hypothetical protein